MKGFKHTHVLHLVGVVIENNRAYVILPYMENGDMKTFISNGDNVRGSSARNVHNVFNINVVDAWCFRCLPGGCSAGTCLFLTSSPSACYIIQ